MVEIHPSSCRSTARCRSTHDDDDQSYYSLCRCGHGGVCFACSKRLLATCAKCPLCRAPIREVGCDITRIISSSSSYHARRLFRSFVRSFVCAMVLCAPHRTTRRRRRTITTASDERPSPCCADDGCVVHDDNGEYKWAIRADDVECLHLSVVTIVACSFNRTMCWRRSRRTNNLVFCIAVLVTRCCATMRAARLSMRAAAP